LDPLAQRAHPLAEHGELLRRDLIALAVARLDVGPLEQPEESIVLLGAHREHVLELRGEPACELAELLNVMGARLVREHHEERGYVVPLRGLVEAERRFVEPPPPEAVLVVDVEPSGAGEPVLEILLSERAPLFLRAMLGRRQVETLRG